MNHHKLIKNASWVIVCRIVQAVFTFVIGMVSARYLGPSNYGLIGYAKSVVAFAIPLAQLGLDNVLVEEIVSNPDREGETLGTALIMSVVSSLVSILGVLLFSSIVNAGERETILVCGLQAISLVFKMMEMIQYWYQAKLMSKYVSITSLFAYVIVSAYKIYLLVSKKSILWFSVSEALDFFIIALVLILIYYKIGSQTLKFSFKLAKKMLSRSKYYIFSSMLVTVFSQNDKILIKEMISDAASGFYTAASTCAGATSFVFQAIIDSFRPLIFHYKKNSQANYEKNIERLYSIIFYLGMFQSAFLTCLAPIIVPILYGAEYIAAIPILQIITWQSTFSYMGPVRNIWILAEGKQKCLWTINLLGAILNVSLNFVLIPIIGVCGAAIASVVTQFVSNFLLCYIYKPIRPTGSLILQALHPYTLIEMVAKRVLNQN